MPWYGAACYLLVLHLACSEVLDLARPISGAPVDEPMVMAMQTDIPADAYVLDIDFDLLASGVITEGTLLRVEPSPGMVFTAAVRRISVDVNDALGIAAPLVGQPDGYFVVSVTGHIAFGEVVLSGQSRRYQIVYDPETIRHIAREVPEDDIDFIPPDCDLAPPVPDVDVEIMGRLGTMAEPLIAGDPLEEVLVRLMVVYTPAAATWASQNAGGINNVINMSVVRAQQALDNSNVFVYLDLIHAAQVIYAEHSSSVTNLVRLQDPANGHMDVVHAWRSMHGADIVSLFTLASDTGGLGYQLRAHHLPNGIPTYAFNLVRVQQAATTYTLAHEIGHNMGAHHHSQQVTQPGYGIFGYSAGWRWSNGGMWFNSVMAYSGGNQYLAPAPGAGITSETRPYFSNPNVNHEGQSTGHATQADNARTLNETKRMTANYRNILPPPPPPPSGVNIGFRAIALDNRVMLRWMRPTSLGFGSDRVRIQYNTTGYPAHEDDGHHVYQGFGQEVIHPSSSPGIPHYYTIWVSHDGHTFIPP